MTDNQISNDLSATSLSDTLRDLSQAEIEIAELRSERERLKIELGEALGRLSELEGAVEPRLKSILTLKPLLFALKQRNRIKRGELGVGGGSNSQKNSECTSTVLSQLSPTSPPQTAVWGSLGIAVFAHTRSECLHNMLESLARQDALHNTHVFIDGDQGRPNLKSKIDRVFDITKMYPVKQVHRQRGAFGFRKMMLVAGQLMAQHYSRIIFLEDDCFPVDNAIAEFMQELNAIESDDNIFSVYGHPFLTASESGAIGRFQSWGWATTAVKLKPIWQRLQECYLMPESEYLEFVQKNLTDEIKKRIDVTPGRQPSETLSKFFAWDETTCLLTALAGQQHRATSRRLIYNCGAGLESTHFQNLQLFRQPPFNMIGADEVWDYFDQ